MPGCAGHNTTHRRFPFRWGIRSESVLRYTLGCEGLLVASVDLFKTSIAIGSNWTLTIDAGLSGAPPWKTNESAAARTFDISV